jgi:Transposase DDE domain group 1
MTAECNQFIFGFHPQKRREIRVQFDGGAITSDGGGLLLREVEKRIGILHQFQVLYVFLVLAHDRRRILHFNVTARPTAEWTGQQLREAFPFDQLPCYLLRDRDRHLREQHRQNFVGCYAAMRRSSMSVNMSWRTAS